jgi:hypothetical protein
MTATKKTSKKATKRDANLVPLSEAMPKKNGKTKAAAKAVEPKGEKKLSLLDAATQVLKASKEPMNCKAIIEAVFAKKLWASNAPTPAATLASAIIREMSKKAKDSRFKKVDRGQFAYAG